MAGLVVKPRSRIFHGHEWIYASEVQKTFGNPVPGAVIALKDFKDRRIGTGIYNPKSQIVARRFSRRKQELDKDFFVRRIQRALKYRATLDTIDPTLSRILWSESDGLPGVIVDRYGDYLVLQTLTLAMDQRKNLIVEALQEQLAPKGILERNDAPVRTAEGLESVVGVLSGEKPEPFRVETDNGSFYVDLIEGQKTGLYLDQLSNYAAVRAYAKDRRVLDCFANQGGFSLACAKGGAKEVIAVESSESACATGRENAKADGLSVDFVEANVFDYLKDADKNDEKFDLIILDPPSFTRSKKSLKDAIRGYKEIHLRALKLLEPGGRLATFCCSHHMSPNEFLGVVRSAAVDAKKTLLQRDIYLQRADHPVLPTVPESEYLRGYAFEILGAW